LRDGAGDRRSRDDAADRRSRAGAGELRRERRTVDRSRDDAPDRWSVDRGAGSAPRATRFFLLLPG